MIRPYVVKFEHLSLGEHDFDFEADKSLFEGIEGEEILDAKFKIYLTLYKTGNMMDMTFHYFGEIVVPCDRCSEPVSVEIDETSKLVAKYGQVHHEDLDEMVVLEDHEHEIDLSQYFYEILSLAIPVRHVHDEKDCNPEILSKLINRDEESPGDVDPRWEKLKDL